MEWIQKNLAYFDFFGYDLNFTLNKSENLKHASEVY